MCYFAYHSQKIHPSPYLFHSFHCTFEKSDNVHLLSFKVMKIKKIHSATTFEVYSASTETEVLLPVATGTVSAGFPSPAMDFEDLSIDLNKYIVKHAAATFYIRVKGDSMKDAGINDGDLLVVDRSLDPTNDKIAVCFIDGEFTVKRIKIEQDLCWLVPENEKYKPIKVTAENQFIVWGIVTYVLKAV